MTKQPYIQPELKAIGSVANLTQTGTTNPGGDAKQGSVMHSQGR